MKNRENQTMEQLIEIIQLHQKMMQIAEEIKQFLKSENRGNYALRIVLSNQLSTLNETIEYLRILGLNHKSWDKLGRGD